MANSFKSDESFLRKLALGAAGTNATIGRLRLMGFKPIELERGSTGFKIWKRIKIKRIRVPDVLCLRTGLRFESRGKTKLEISMSHSLSDPRRAWDAGMRDDDIVSIVAFEQKDDIPVNPKQISPVHFVCVKEMRKAFAEKQVSTTRPKGVEEGSEIRVAWNCAVASHRSVVAAVDPERIILNSAAEARCQSVRLRRRRGGLETTLLPQVALNETVEANQIVAAVVPIKTALGCPPSVNEDYFVEIARQRKPKRKVRRSKGAAVQGLRNRQAGARIQNGRWSRRYIRPA